MNVRQYQSLNTCKPISHLVSYTSRGPGPGPGICVWGIGELVNVFDLYSGRNLKNRISWLGLNCLPTPWPALAPQVGAVFAALLYVLDEVNNLCSPVRTSTYYPIQSIQSLFIFCLISLTSISQLQQSWNWFPFHLRRRPSIKSCSLLASVINKACERARTGVLPTGFWPWVNAQYSLYWFSICKCFVS